jgi:hypothetical protein
MADTLADKVIQNAVSRVQVRAERQENVDQLVETFVDPGISVQLENTNNQILYGRRGTGKTHVLKVVEKSAGANGLRRAEVVACRWADFDMVRGRLRVFRKGQNWYWLPLAPDVVSELRASARELQPELDDFVFTVYVEQWVSQFERMRRQKNPKVPASDQALWRMVSRVCRRAGVRELSPHQLRHGFANRFMRESGRDVTALKGLMGHSRIDTTQAYTDEIELDELALALERALLARNAQASPDLATLDADVAATLQSREWRRRESNPRKISIGLAGQHSARWWRCNDKRARSARVAIDG